VGQPLRRLQREWVHEWVQEPVRGVVPPLSTAVALGRGTPSVRIPTAAGGAGTPSPQLAEACYRGGGRWYPSSLFQVVLQRGD